MVLWRYCKWLDPPNAGWAMRSHMSSNIARLRPQLCEAPTLARQLRLVVPSSKLRHLVQTNTSPSVILSDYSVPRCLFAQFADVVTALTVVLEKYLDLGSGRESVHSAPQLFCEKHT